MPARLVTIPISHYCEKARWALDRAAFPYVEAPHAPGLHVLFVRAAGVRASRSVPVLATRHGVVTDSTEILRLADRGLAERDRLFPDGALGADVHPLEERFDADLGPAARRIAYGHVLGDGNVARRLFTRNVPRLEAIVMGAAAPRLAATIRRAYGIHDAGIARSRDKVRALFDEVARRLADGRRYLAGDRFTAADLTFAALATPILLPPEHARWLGELADVPPAMRAEVEAYRADPAGAYALRLYREERGRRVS